MLPGDAWSPLAAGVSQDEDVWTPPQGRGTHHGCPLGAFGHDPSAPGQAAP